MSHVVFSVDPASTSHAVCVWVDGTLTELFTVPDTIQGIQKALKKHGPSMVYMENQWLGRSFKSVVTLLEARIRFQTLAELSGSTVQLIHPVSWQAFCGLSKLKSVEIKKYTQRIATEYTKSPITHMDIADAVCIGLYGMKYETDCIQEIKSERASVREAARREAPTTPKKAKVKKDTTPKKRKTSA